MALTVIIIVIIFIIIIIVNIQLQVGFNIDSHLKKVVLFIIPSVNYTVYMSGILAELNSFI